MLKRRGRDLKVMYNVPLRMRDGVILYCNVYRPDDDEKYPAIITRTSYLKDNLSAVIGFLRAQDTAMQGYNVVVQDVRGTGWSEGVVDPAGHQAEDGFDTVEAVAACDWCDGNVGVIGESFLGYTTMTSAVNHPPHLKAICPLMTSWTKFPGMYGYGVYALVQYGWVFGRAVDRGWYFGDMSQAAKDAMEKIDRDPIKAMLTLPVVDMPTASVPDVPGLGFHRELLENIDNDEYLREIGRSERFEDVEVPALSITGWADFLRDKSIENYCKFRDQSGSEKARSNARLIVGPWAHGDLMSPVVDGFYYGKQASIDGSDITGKIIGWFDRWLKDKDSEYMSGAPIKLFILGKNEWRDEYEWPLARTQYVDYYIHSDGKANSLHGDGTLTTAKPTVETPDHYLYNPGDPVFSSTGDPLTSIYQDQRPIEERGDVLVYTSEPLEKDVELTGPVNCELWAASDCVDTDFVAKFVDVYPDGKAIPLCSKLIRARYRNGHTPEFLEKNRPTLFHIDVGNVGMMFYKGHSFRLEITSSLFPDADRNLNTGGKIGFEAHYNLAVQTILHDEEHPTHITLPFIPVD